MMMPSVFGDRFFDDFMNDFMWPARQPHRPHHRHGCGPRHEFHPMKTDIVETEEGFEISMDLPGYDKEEVKAQLKDGYLTVSAERNEAEDTKDEEGRYIRRERFSGSYQRSFFVGKDVTQDDIRAKFEDGVLKLEIPKDVPKKVEEKQVISIEG